MANLFQQPDESDEIVAVAQSAGRVPTNAGAATVPGRCETRVHCVLCVHRGDVRRDQPRRKTSGFPLRLEIDPELLTLLIEVAALEAERAGGVGDAMAVRRELREHDFTLERVDAARERA